MRNKNTTAYGLKYDQEQQLYRKSNTQNINKKNKFRKENYKVNMDVSSYGNNKAPSIDRNLYQKDSL